MPRTNVEGVGIAAWNGDEIIYLKTYGMRDTKEATANPAYWRRFSVTASPAGVGRVQAFEVTAVHWVIASKANLLDYAIQKSPPVFC